MNDEHRDGCQCHGCVCSRYELEIHSLSNDIQHERETVAEQSELIAILGSAIEYEFSRQCMESSTQNRKLYVALTKFREKQNATD